MRIMIGKVGEWFDKRLQLAAPIREAVEHPVPRMIRRRSPRVPAGAPLD